MNRLQKKCFIASTGFHLLLGLVLLVGTGFLSSRKPPEDRPPSRFIPAKTIDELFSNPGAGSPAPQSQPPAPLPQPQPQVQPTPPPSQPQVRTPEPPKPISQKAELADSKAVKKLPDVSLTPVRRPKNNQTPKQRPPNADAQSDASADKAKQIASAARNAAKDLRGRLSSATVIEMSEGGGSGVSYANFLDSLKKIYSDAWIVPDGVTDDEATAKASVTIARDGRVVSWKIIRSSGNSLADASVEMALRRVTIAVPLPDSSKEDQRTVTIFFNVKAKRGLG